MMGWLGNIDPDDFYYAQHHTDGTSNCQKILQPRGRPTAGRRPRRDRPTTPATTIYAKAATIIADECSYIYLYNPSVIQAWTPGLSGLRGPPRQGHPVRDRSSRREVEQPMTRVVTCTRSCASSRAGCSYSLVVLIGVLVVVFALVHLVPGDPVRIALGTRYTPEAYDALRAGKRPGPAAGRAVLRLRRPRADRRPGRQLPQRRPRHA